MNLLDKYHQRMFDAYMQAHPNTTDPGKVMNLICNLTEEHMIDIPCEMKNNVTHNEYSTTITGVCDWIDQNNPIITGNGTFFKQHSEYLSPTVNMLESLQKKRGEMKKIMYQFGQGTVNYNNAFTAQNSVKVIMNADYGGAGTKFAPFYSMYIPPSTTLTAQSVTTTLICCLEFVSNPEHHYSRCNHINELFDMIHQVLNDKEERDLIQDKFSVEEVLQRLISITNEMRLEDIKVLKQYLQSLRSEQLTKLMLAFNVHFVLQRYVANDVAATMDYFKSNPIKLEEMTGASGDRQKYETTLLDQAGFGEKIPPPIEDRINHIRKVILDNCIYKFMLNDNEIRAREMKRKIVCVTDTDSLMVHFSHYIDSFQSRVNNFRDSCLFASALGFRLFVEGIIPKFVTYISEGMNINDEYFRKKFQFKNEYCYLAMTLFAKKMYASSMFAQEGVPRSPHKLQITGLSFKKRDAAEFLEPIMLELYDKYILTSKEIQVDKILDEYYALRSRLLKELDSDPSYFKVLSIKDENAYDSSKALPGQVRGVKVWNSIMVDEQINPMDRAIFIPLSWEKIDANMHISQVVDVCKLTEQLGIDTVRAAELRAKRNDKKLTVVKNPERSLDPYICLPEHYKVFPDWISCIINTEENVDKLLTPFKQLLGLFDVFMAPTKGGMQASRMISI